MKERGTIAEVFAGLARVTSKRTTREDYMAHPKSGKPVLIVKYNATLQRRKERAIEKLIANPLFGEAVAVYQARAAPAVAAVAAAEVVREELAPVVAEAAAVIAAAVAKPSAYDPQPGEDEDEYKKRMLATVQADKTKIPEVRAAILRAQPFEMEVATRKVMTPEIQNIGQAPLIPLTPTKFTKDYSRSWGGAPLKEFEPPERQNYRGDVVYRDQFIRDYQRPDVIQVNPYQTEAERLAAKSAINQEMKMALERFNVRGQYGSGLASGKYPRQNKGNNIEMLSDIVGRVMEPFINRMDMYNVDIEEIDKIAAELKMRPTDVIKTIQRIVDIALRTKVWPGSSVGTTQKQFEKDFNEDIRKTAEIAHPEILAVLPKLKASNLIFAQFVGGKPPPLVGPALFAAPVATPLAEPVAAALAAAPAVVPAAAPAVVPAAAPMAAAPMAAAPMAAAPVAAAPMAAAPVAAAPMAAAPRTVEQINRDILTTVFGPRADMFEIVQAAPAPPRGPRNYTPQEAEFYARPPYPADPTLAKAEIQSRLNRDLAKIPMRPKFKGVVNGVFVEGTTKGDMNDFQSKATDVVRLYSRDPRTYEIYDDVVERIVNRTGLSKDYVIKTIQEIIEYTIYTWPHSPKAAEREQSYKSLNRTLKRELRNDPGAMRILNALRQTDFIFADYINP